MAAQAAQADASTPNEKRKRTCSSQTDDEVSALITKNEVQTQQSLEFDMNDLSTKMNSKATSVRLRKHWKTYSTVQASWIMGK